MIGINITLENIFYFIGGVLSIGVLAYITLSIWESLWFKFKGYVEHRRVIWHMIGLMIKEPDEVKERVREGKCECYWCAKGRGAKE